MSASKVNWKLVPWRLGVEIRRISDGLVREISDSPGPSAELSEIEPAPITTLLIAAGLTMRKRRSPLGRAGPECRPTNIPPSDAATPEDGRVHGSLRRTSRASFT